MILRKTISTLSGSVLAALLMAAVGSANADPVKIRLAWVVIPSNLEPLMLKVPGLAQHEGKSYVLDPEFIGASSAQITALATNEIDIASFNYSALSLAVLNANLVDVRVLADQIRDGVPGHYSASYYVRKDAGIRTIEDLKGKILATNGYGSAAQMAITIMTSKYSLKEKTDYQLVEVPFPAMAPELESKKIDLAIVLPAFATNPTFQGMSQLLFTQRDAFGPSELSFMAARTPFIEKNRGALVDFLEDYVRAVQWFTDPKNRDQAVGIVASAMKLPPDAIKGWVFTDTNDFYRDPNGAVDLDALQHNIETSKDLGAIPSMIDAKKYVDLSLVKEAAARIK